MIPDFFIILWAARLPRSIRCRIATFRFRILSRRRPSATTTTVSTRESIIDLTTKRI
jgi:hypothetical protein